MGYRAKDQGPEHRMTMEELDRNLKVLLDEGLVEKAPFPGKPGEFYYRPTDKGRAEVPAARERLRKAGVKP